MSRFSLRFIAFLERPDVEPTRHHGPLFHRWLPNGIEDAIVLDTGEADVTLRVWFERLGFVGSDGYIYYDAQRREVDASIVPRQAVLDAGPLFGLIEVAPVPDDDLEPLIQDKQGDDRYIALGKRVVKKLIHPATARFIDTLRTIYGQYWIGELRAWDSRRQSLGSYCADLSLEWTIDGTTWNRFRPDQPVDYLVGSYDFRLAAYLRYLTREDWERITRLSAEKYEPPLAASILAGTHELLDKGNVRHALIEGVSALEIALSSFMRQALQHSKLLLQHAKSFYDLPLPARVVIALAAQGQTDPQDLELALKSIRYRNKVVHEGVTPPDDAEESLIGLVRVVAKLVSSVQLKFPSADFANMLLSEDEWVARQGEPAGDD